MELKQGKYGRYGNCKKCGKKCTDIELNDKDEKEVGECYSCTLKERESNGGIKMKKEKNILSLLVEPPKITITVSEPKFSEAKKLTKEDVWGKFENHQKVSNGMVVARCDERCPHFKDIVPFKSVTVVCRKDELNEVAYWLEFVQGADCISRCEAINDLQFAIRADYMAW